MKNRMEPSEEAASRMGDRLLMFNVCFVSVIKSNDFKSAGMRMNIFYVESWASSALLASKGATTVSVTTLE